MAKAQLTLPNGTVVEIEGSTQEVKELLEFYGGTGGGGSAPPRQAAKKSARKKAAEKEVADTDTEVGPNLCTTPVTVSCSPGSTDSIGPRRP